MKIKVFVLAAPAPVLKLIYNKVVDIQQVINKSARKLWQTQMIITKSS